MQEGRFAEEQMVAIVREADRDHVSTVAKPHGVSEKTIYSWCKRFGNFAANDVRRAKRVRSSTNKGSAPRCNGPGRCNMGAFASTLREGRIEQTRNAVSS